jgi:hypothetical protein
MNNRPLTLVEVEDEEFELIKRILNVNNNYESLQAFMTRIWEKYANA